MLAGAVPFEDLPVAALLARGFGLLPCPTPCEDAPAALTILALEREDDLFALGRPLRQPSRHWLAWNRSDDPALTLAAYAAGALAVLPRTVTAPALLRMLDTALASAPPHPAPPPQTRRSYQRDAPISLAPDELLTVDEGVVAQTMIEPDGTEVLMGLFGPGQILIGHPEDSCAIYLIAHTAACVSIQPWSAALADFDLPTRLRARVRLLEAWSAVQARPHLDQRLIGILSLLGEQFGHPHSEGLLVDLRITHAQIAAAIGATRSTVSRLLSSLRARKLLTTCGSGTQERFCLLRWEVGQHSRG